MQLTPYPFRLAGSLWPPIANHDHTNSAPAYDSSAAHKELRNFLDRRPITQVDDMPIRTTRLRNPVAAQAHVCVDGSGAGRDCA